MDVNTLVGAGEAGVNAMAGGLARLRASLAESAGDDAETTHGEAVEVGLGSEDWPLRKEVLALVAAANEHSERARRRAAEAAAVAQERVAALALAAQERAAEVAEKAAEKAVEAADVVEEEAAAVAQVAAERASEAASLASDVVTDNSASLSDAVQEAAASGSRAGKVAIGALLAAAAAGGSYVIWRRRQAPPAQDLWAEHAPDEAPAPAAPASAAVPDSDDEGMGGIDDPGDALAHEIDEVADDLSGQVVDAIEADAQDTAEAVAESEVVAEAEEIVDSAGPSSPDGPA